MPILGPNGCLIAEAEELLKAAAPMIEEMFAARGLGDDNTTKLLQAGYELKDIYGLTDDEMDALFHSGFDALRSGAIEQAKLFFAKLCQLDSLNAHYVFALASAFQLDGDFEAAGRLYVVVVSLKATWVDAYIRLGECLIASGEVDNAREILEIGVELAGEDEEQVGQAKALLSHILNEDVTVQSKATIVN